MEKNKKKKTSVYVDPMLWEKIRKDSAILGSNQTAALNEGLLLWLEANQDEIASAYAVEAKTHPAKSDCKRGTGLSTGTIG